MTIAERIAADPKAREHRGSRARCLMITDCPQEEVARDLTALTTGWARVDPNRHFWMPRGSQNSAEAKIGETPGFMAEHASELIGWWLAAPGRADSTHRANIPNWDIASTAEIDGRQGLLLVEAKSYAQELGEGGKHVKRDASPDSKANHERIAEAIREANQGLRAATGADWKLSRDNHYQLANRFAWAWKIASLGYPVALVYLGFIAAEEMRHSGRDLIASEGDWEKRVREYASGVVPRTAWNSTILIADGAAEGTPLRAIITAIRIDLLR